MSYLKSIPRQPGGGQLGGILTIDVVSKSQVESIPAPVNGIVGPVVLKEGASFVRWNVTQQSAGLSGASNATREGKSKTNNLNFFIPLDREDLRPMLEIAEHDELIVIYSHPNGKRKIIGTLEAPVQFEFSHGTGTKWADRNGNNCSFYYKGPENTFFYSGDAPVITPGPAPAVVKFNGTVIASLAPGETLDITSDYSFTDYFTS